MGGFPNLIKILIIDENSKKPASSIAISIRLFAKRKNDYYFTFISDNDGIIELHKSILQKKIIQEKSMYIMDFSSDLEDCELKLEIGIMNTEEITHIIDYLNQIKRFPEYNQIDIDKYTNLQNYKYDAVCRTFDLEDSNNMNFTFMIKQL